MKIYDFPASPNCRKVRAVAYELGLTPTFVPLNILGGDSRSAAFLAKNPNGKVPVLEDGDFLLWESNAIAAYLAALRPQAGLIPAEPRPRADVDRWISWEACHMGPAVGKVAYERIVRGMIRKEVPDSSIVEAGTAEFRTLAPILDAALKGREFVAGRLSVADFCLSGFLLLADDVGLDTSAYPAVSAWLDRLRGRESVRRTLTEARAALAG